MSALRKPGPGKTSPGGRRPWRAARRRKPGTVPPPSPAWNVLAALLLLVVAALLYRFPEENLQRAFYPLRYQRTLVEQSRRAGVSPTLVAAVVLHESSFRPHAQSSVGARGLMQLMPETAHWVDEYLEGGPSRASVDAPSGKLDLSDPETNLRLGSAYLGYLEERFRDQPVAVLAAYNAGPECTLDWLSQAPGGILRLEDLGYPETRAYVKAVLDSERMYRKLYPELTGR